MADEKEHKLVFGTLNFCIRDLTVYEKILSHTPIRVFLQNGELSVMM